MFRKIKSFNLLLLTLSLASCSVYKASSNEGITVSDIKKCRTEGCFLSYGMDIISKHDNDKDDNKLGQHVVVYRAIARKSGGNYIRAAGHGVLDVMTLGLWEIAGTPVEGALSNNRGYITAKVIYARKGDDIAHEVKIYDAYGKMVVNEVFHH